MKKIYIIALSILSFGAVFAQKRSERSIQLRGPIAPVDSKYTNYKSYSIKINAPKNLEEDIKRNGGVYSLSTLAENFEVYGLKSTLDGDFTINYNITRFEFIDSRSFQKSPAYVMGIEANVEVKDKEGNIIFKRYRTPRANTYVVDIGKNLTSTVYRALYLTYLELIQDFESYFLHGPILKARYIELTKLPKNTDLNDFNLSTQVFPSLVGVSREDWPKLFGEAQKYWLTLLKYNNSKDDDAIKDVRMAAFYNLGFSHLLLGNIAEAEKYLIGVKENDRKFLGMASNYDLLSANIREVKEFTTTAQELKRINPIEAEPQLADYQKSSDVFKFVLLEGEAVDKKNERLQGKIKIMNDNPPVVDFRLQESSQGLVGGLLSSLKVENSTVYIEVLGAKKPTRKKIDDLLFIKTKEGKTYYVGVVGNALEVTSRYSLLEEVKTHKKLSVYAEFFPQSDYTLKRPNEEKFYEIPVFGIKKSLKTYFEDCPKMQPKIDTGEFNSYNAENYIRLFETYTTLCGK